MKERSRGIKGKPAINMKKAGKMRIKKDSKGGQTGSKREKMVITT